MVLDGKLSGAPCTVELGFSPTRLSQQMCGLTVEPISQFPSTVTVPPSYTIVLVFPVDIGVISAVEGYFQQTAQSRYHARRQQ